jgi:hypothetical protein
VKEALGRDAGGFRGARGEKRREKVTKGGDVVEVGGETAALL